MKKRSLYILVGIGIILALAALIIFFYKRNGSGTVGNLLPSAALPGTLPENFGSGLNRAPSGDTIAIGTPQGSVPVKNFYKNVVDTEEGSLILREASAYTIGYNTLNSAFKIVIFAGPVGTVRAQAENDLLDILSVPKEQACKLSIREVVYAGVDNNPAEQAYPLSLCP